MICSFADRLTYIFIEVSQDGTQYHKCATLGDVGEPPFVDRLCDTKVLGRYVRLRRLRSAHEGNAMNVCEVQVYAYKYEGECSKSWCYSVIVHAYANALGQRLINNAIINHPYLKQKLYRHR